MQTGFDANGNVAALLLPHGNGVTYTYDARDRRIARTDALGQVERWTYDKMDRVTTYTDRRNRVTTYGYDTLGRATTTSFPGMGGTLTASYDAGNRLVALADSLSGTLGWDYDNFDQVAAANSPQGTMTYGYDAAGRRTKMQAATQAAVVYGYDNADRMIGITQGAEKVSFAYNNANRPRSMTLPNQVQTVYVYNDANQVTGLAWGKAGQAALGSLGYAYDSLGHLVAQTGPHAPKALPPASTNNSFDDNNRQTQANGVALSYDDNGNLLNDGSRSYVWDDRDRLSQITQGGTVIASYSYDALGRRTAKTEGGATTQYLYDGRNPVQETQGTTINPILTGLGIDQRYARNDTGGRTYFLTDQLGSTRVLTNAAGGAVQRYDYDPYGTTTQSSTAYTNPYQYTGRERDTSGLYYYRARYYKPELGRFISEDPIKLTGGVNSYSYVGGNPLSRIDPLGLSWGDAISLTYQWATGSGPQHQDFGPGSSEAAEMANAPGVLAAEALYRKKNAQRIKNNCDKSTFEPVTDYAASFGLKGLFQSGLNPTEQFIGSYSVDIYPSGDGQMDVVINNTSSFKSFAYGLAPDWDRSQFGPMGNMSQTIHITAKNQ
ncbi:RHS repeat-associated core domain-containing protein [Xanthomonas axonopodis pv. vasculorum]|uniref:RHS repeat-associated core domain-containing protein n=1 Tax=Xanthomonas axonopodis TaxID=53413 RepID=UPI001FD1E0E6|nr:RHS repeat-associated core domain-containing protein [Xanthomonas axonopodis]